MTDDGKIWVIDSSTLIDIKVSVRVEEQWDTGSRLLALVKKGRIVFPKQVRDEVTYSRYPDLPGAWVAKAWKVMPKRPRGDSNNLRTVLGVEPNWRRMLTLEEKDIADPYVVETALTLRQQVNGSKPTVVTKDSVMVYVCNSLRIPNVGLNTFLQVCLN